MQILKLILAFGVVIALIFIVIIFYATIFGCMTMVLILSLGILGKTGFIILWSVIALYLLGYGIYKDHNKMIAWIKGLRK
jgi:hypothetical protein